MLLSVDDKIDFMIRRYISGKLDKIDPTSAYIIFCVKQNTFDNTFC